MRGFPMQNVSALKKKNTIKENKFDVDKLADKDDQRFLDKQKEERVKYSELDAKGKAIYNKNRQKSGLAPLKQEGPVTKSNIGLLETENKDANVYKGSNLQERINDYEDRIEFLNSDLEDFGQQPGQDPSKIKKDIKKLNQELEILEKRRANKTDQGRYSDLEKYDDDRG